MHSRLPSRLLPLECSLRSAEAFSDRSAPADRPLNDLSDVSGVLLPFSNAGLKASLPLATATPSRERATPGLASDETELSEASLDATRCRTCAAQNRYSCVETARRYSPRL
eukprot:701069-Pleurochrysis_carterae.AAC.2